MASKKNEFLSIQPEQRFGLLTDDDMHMAAAYGTRAIIDKVGPSEKTHYVISFVPGRFTAKGMSNDLDKMEKFLNKAGTKKAMAKFAERVGMASSAKMTLESPDGFALEATPNASYGYMYIKMVWRKPL